MRRAGLAPTPAPPGRPERATAPPEPAVAVRQGTWAAVLIMVGSWGVGWLPMTPDSVFSGSTLLNPLRVNLPGVLASTLLLASGSLLLVRAWLVLGRSLRGRWEGHGRLVSRAAWQWSAPLMLALPIFSRDVFSYLQQGRLLALGLDPYTQGVSALPGWFMQGADSIWAESPSPYGPLFLLCAEAIWRVTGGRIELSVTAFRLLALAGLALCLWAVPRLAEAAGRCGAWAAWVCVANPLFLLYMIAGVHNDALMSGLMLAGIVLMVRVPRRRLHALWGIVLIALSVAIKPLTALVLPFVALLLPTGWDRFRRADPGLRRRDRLGPWITTAAIALAVLTILGAGSGLWFGWVPAMLTSGDAAFPYAPVGVLGLLLGAAADGLAGLPARAVAGGFYTLMTLAALGFGAWLALRRRAPEPVSAAAAVLFVAVVTAPIVQPWYLLWVLPLLACALRPLPWGADHPRWLGWVTALAVLLLTGVGVVDQISVAQWLPVAAVRALTAVVVLAGIAWIVVRDPATAPLFPGRRRPPREVVEPREAVGPREPGAPPGPPAAAPDAEFPPDAPAPTSADAAAPPPTAAPLAQERP
ncbi:polyprenol phosphomannose-dependent alpha 1,6 mannosyltransferase MptB [Micrococcus endophyticus]|uniref:polyprenol phosphomannose-dependent alpha 1,6 mannosyltransferase MptB n=1 Tax=Micrococcus endophyticus TaxID=455343 RepID=UPI00200697C6